jgi:hypothetical protein
MSLIELPPLFHVGLPMMRPSRDTESGAVLRHRGQGPVSTTLDLVGAPHRFVFREVPAQRVVDGPTLLRSDHHDLAVILARAPGSRSDPEHLEAPTRSR